MVVVSTPPKDGSHSWRPGSSSIPSSSAPELALKLPKHVNLPRGKEDTYRDFRLRMLQRLKTVWFLVGNEGMEYGAYYWGVYRDYYRDPFPHSLLSTRRKMISSFLFLQQTKADLVTS